MAGRTIVFTTFPGIQPLDLTGPHEVFATASRVVEGLGRNEPGYELVIAATASGPVVAESGMAIYAPHALSDISEPIHTLVIPGGDGAVDASHPELVAWLGQHAAGAQRVATICTGTFLAAAAGLCDHKRVTTHWSRAGELAQQYPNITVDPDPIYIFDDGLWTSAGVTAGIDLALALVEHDLGPEVARIVARYLVVYLHRPGGQSQFAAPVWSKSAEAAPIRLACEIIHDELAGDLSVDALAERVGLSSRHFTRRFRSEIGEPVGRHIERLRVEAARQILETDSVGLEAVAARCGFGTTETLRRAFHRRLEISPDAYRRQFSSSSQTSSS